MRTRLFAALALLGAGACSSNPELVPEPNPSALPAPANTASGEAEGIRLEINTDAWTGLPRDLGDNFTPVLVTLTNDGTQLMRVRYSDFVLHGPNADLYHALPPFRITDTVNETIDALVDARGFLIAPYLSPYYPRMRIYASEFPLDQIYFDRYHPTFVEIQLPTSDMVRRALPEGVLEPGGKVSGFLYFEDPEDEVGRVTLRHMLITPEGGEIGRIEIPLATKN